MKSLIETAVFAVLAAAPLSALAQSDQPATRAKVREELIDQPVTRAQVRDELIRLEKAGYRPTSRTDNIHYPAEIQAALAALSR